MRPLQAALSAAVSISLLVFTGQALAAGSYAVSDLGTSFVGAGMNNLGEVAGSVGNQAAVWVNGATTVLSSSNSQITASQLLAVGVDDAGVIVGRAVSNNYNGGGVLAWLNPTAAPTVLLPDVSGHGNNSSDVPVALNGVGQLLYTTNTTGSNSGATSTVGVVVSGNVVGLGGGVSITPCGFYSANGPCWVGTGLNNHGDVVGNDGHGDVQLFRNGAWTNVSSGFTANSVNNGDDVVGGTTGTSSGTAILWNGTAKVSLGAGVAEYVNNAGTIVGQSGTGQAVLWGSGSTTALTLDSLVDPALGWHFTNALQINDNGEILATGTLGSGTVVHTVLLQAVPEPQAYVFLAAGLGLLVCGARARHSQDAQA